MTNYGARNGVPLSEDQARRLICTNLAELMRQGSCTVRVRCLRDERRTTFLAEHSNRWQPIPDMDYQSGTADSILKALTAVGTKRNKDLHINIQNGGNFDDITIGIHKDAVSQHRSNLYQFVYGQLFWD